MGCQRPGKHLQKIAMKHDFSIVKTLFSLKVLSFSDSQMVRLMENEAK